MGGSGYPGEITEHTRERLSIANTGVGNPMFGSNEDRIGVRNPMFNKRHSEDARKKIAERSAREIHPTSRKVEDKSGRIWSCVKECSEFFEINNSHLSSMLKGTRKVYHYLKHLDLHYLDERSENYEFVSLEELEKIAIPKKEKKYKNKLSEISKCSKKVIDKNGTIYNSVRECSKILNISGVRLNSFLLGVWKFPPELEPLELKYLNPEHNEIRYERESRRNELDKIKKDKNFYKPSKSKIEREIKIIDKYENVYNSIKECADHFNINPSNLSGMLSGSKKKSKYVEELELKYLV